MAQASCFSWHPSTTDCAWIETRKLNCADFLFSLRLLRRPNSTCIRQPQHFRDRLTASKRNLTEGWQLATGNDRILPRQFTYFGSPSSTLPLVDVVLVFQSQKHKQHIACRAGHQDTIQLGAYCTNLTRLLCVDSRVDKTGQRTKETPRQPIYKYMRGPHRQWRVIQKTAAKLKAGKSRTGCITTRR